MCLVALAVVLAAFGALLAALSALLWNSWTSSSAWCWSTQSALSVSQLLTFPGRWWEDYREGKKANYQLLGCPVSLVVQLFSYWSTELVCNLVPAGSAPRPGSWGRRIGRKSTPSPTKIRKIKKHRPLSLPRLLLFSLSPLPRASSNS